MLSFHAPDLLALLPLAVASPPVFVLLLYYGPWVFVVFFSEILLERVVRDENAPHKQKGCDKLRKSFMGRAPCSV
jgi:hypothetical protein